MDRNHPFLPLLAAFAAVGVLSLMDALMKGASLAGGVYTAAFLRSSLALALIGPVWLATGARWPERAVLHLHLLRGVVATFMALLFFYALTKLPLAETIAISFVAPLVALWLAAWLLGERIQRKAVGAAVLGMAGTLVIVGGRIGRERMDEGVWLGLAAIMASALLYAWNLILQRQQAQRAKPAEVAVFHSGVATVILACGLPFLWQTPATEVLWQAGASALLTVAGSLLFAWAYARAEAQALVPIEYSGFLWAALFGWLFFAEGVTGTTVLGTGLIVIGCWLAARRRPLPDEV
jgi:S-adenosylmethionine uptake transporter